MITKAERTELRSVVRQQFKVLRAEVEQRRAELLADVDDQVADHYQDDDAKWRGVLHVAQEAVSEANRRINDALYEGGFEEKGPTERNLIMVYGLERPRKELQTRHEVKQVAAGRITAQVKAAILRLDREEADLLRQLAIGALESEEAHAFLGSIPSVSELVPTSRMTELAAAVDAIGDDS